MLMCRPGRNSVVCCSRLLVQSYLPFRIEYPNRGVLTRGGWLSRHCHPKRLQTILRGFDGNQVIRSLFLARPVSDRHRTMRVSIAKGHINHRLTLHLIRSLQMYLTASTASLEASVRPASAQWPCIEADTPSRVLLLRDHNATLHANLSPLAPKKWAGLSH